MRLNGSQPIVPSEATTLFDAQRRHRKIELIVKDDYLLSRHAVAVSEQANSISRVVHVRLWDCHRYPQVANTNFVYEGTLFTFAQFRRVTLGENLNNICAYVVARTSVFIAWIS
jgi:hypothetical protein